MDSPTWGDKEGPLIYNQDYVWADTFTPISDSISNMRITMRLRKEKTRQSASSE